MSGRNSDGHIVARHVEVAVLEEFHDGRKNDSEVHSSQSDMTVTLIIDETASKSHELRVEDRENRIVACTIAHADSVRRLILHL